jgi:hypothetical protein
MRLFPDNQKCNDYNQECILALKMQICKINAICNPPSSSRFDEEYLSGLRKTL